MYRSFLAALLALAAHAGPVAGQAADGDPVLYRYDGPAGGPPAGVLADGSTGEIAALQAAANLALMACGAETQIDTDGRLGERTRAALAELAACPPVAARLPEGSAAREGAVTEAYWRLLLPRRPVPDARTRARALLFAFEGTDIAANAAWNFCQNTREIYDPAGGMACRTNDPASYLTWGPNGATAGHGRELLAILSRVEHLDPGLIDTAFGDEAGPVRRLFDLRAPRGEDGELRRYLCGIYVDLPRRRAWSAGFATLGARPEVRALYDSVYASASFDGGKIRTFVEAWRDAGFEPTEVDFAFFTDRAAHTRVRNVEVRRLLRRVIEGAGRPLGPAELRRGYARAARVTNVSQRVPRLGRDVAYYIDALEANLTRSEHRAWERMGSRRASAAGLSDERPMPALRVGPVASWQPSGLRPLTEAEAALCPMGVLNPRPPA